MANYLKVPHSDTHITWIKSLNSKSGPVLHFTLHKPNGEPIAKAKLTAEQLHAYICMHNTMK